MTVGLGAVSHRFPGIGARTQRRGAEDLRRSRFLGKMICR